MRVVVDKLTRIAVSGVMALAFFAAPDASAQMYRPEGLAANSMPQLALGLSNDGVRALDDEFREDLRGFDAFGGRSRMDRFTNGGYEKPKPWTMYGRLGIFNFQDTLDPSRSEGGNITFRRTGPKLTGHYYIGIHRTF